MADRHHHGSHGHADHHGAGPDPRRQELVIERTADTAVAAMSVPLRVLDVGCGTGALLRELVVRVPHGEAFVGVDASARALDEARQLSDGRIDLLRARAEALPFADRSFDLVVTSASLHHWGDQRQGVAELARVVSRTGKVVVVDHCAGPLRRAPQGSLPAKGIADLLDAAGLRVLSSETLLRVAWTVPLVRAFVAIPG